MGCYAAKDLYLATIDIMPQQIISTESTADVFYGFVYLITCSKTHKQYVGVTYRPVIKRWKEHVGCADKEHHKDMYRDMAIYGIETFKFEVLYQAPAAMIPKLERESIAKLDTRHHGYNGSKGGENRVPNTNAIVYLRPDKEDLIEALSTPRGKHGAMEIFDADIRTITSWIASYGIPDVWSCVARGHRLPKDEQPTADMLQKMIESMSITQIGAVYGIEASTVRYYLKKYAIDNPRANAKKTGKALLNEPSGKDIQALVDKGMNAVEIGRHFDISPRTMRKIMKRKGIINPHAKNTSKKVRNKPTADQLSKMLETKMVKQIADEYGVSVGAVAYWIKIYGIEHHSPMDHSKGTTVKQYSKEELQELLDQHGTIQKVSKAIGISEGSLYTQYRANGFQLSHRATSTMIDLSSSTTPPAPLPGN